MNAWSRPLAVLVSVAAVLSSVVSGVTFSPQNMVMTPVGIALFSLLAAVAWMVLYGVQTALFWAIARFRGVPGLSVGKLLDRVILCSIPNLVNLWSALLIPGYAIVDHARSLVYTRLSVAFLVWDAGLSATTMHLLNRLEFFNIVTLILLSVLLRSISRLSIFTCVAVNLLLEVCIGLFV